MTREHPVPHLSADITTVEDLHGWFEKLGIVNVGPNPTNLNQLEIMQITSVLAPDRRDRKGQKTISMGVERRLHIALGDHDEVIVESFESGFSRTERRQKAGAVKEQPTRQLTIDANTRLDTLSANDKGLVDVAFVATAMAKFLEGNSTTAAEDVVRYQRMHNNLTKYFPNHFNALVA